MESVPRLSEFPRTPGRSLSLVTLVRSLAMTRGDFVHAATLCAARFPMDTVACTVTRAAAAAGTLAGSGTWGSQLGAYRNMQSEFIEALRPTSIVARLVGARRVPFQTRAPRVTASTSVGWVAPGAPKPVSEMSYDEVTIGPAKAAGIVIVSQELARSAEPAAEAIIRADLVSAVDQFTDTAFIDPSYTAVLDLHPGSILAGVTPITSAGVTASAVASDLAAAVSALLVGGSQMTSPFWIMRPATAVKLSLLRDTAGGNAFPGIQYNGGILAGIPVLTSNSVPSSTSGGTLIVLLDAAEVLLALGEEVEIDVSTQASVQMNSTPSSTATAELSLFQNDLVGVRAERALNWAPRRAAAAVASYIDQVML